MEETRRGGWRPASEKVWAPVAGRRANSKPAHPEPRHNMAAEFSVYGKWTLATTVSDTLMGDYGRRVNQPGMELSPTHLLGRHHKTGRWKKKAFLRDGNIHFFQHSKRFG